MALPQISIDLIEASNVLGPLALVIVSIAVYGVFVFHFYRFVGAQGHVQPESAKATNQARRPFLRKTISVVFYTFKFLLLYPIFVFIWFAVIAGLLYLMSRNQSIDNVMLAAMGVVGAIRVCLVLQWRAFGGHLQDPAFRAAGHHADRQLDHPDPEFDRGRTRGCPKTGYGDLLPCRRSRAGARAEDIVGHSRVDKG